MLASRLLQAWTHTTAVQPVAFQPGRSFAQSAYTRLQQLAQKVSLKLKPERQASIRAFWEQERGVSDPALLHRARNFSIVYPRYRDLPYLRSQLKVCC